VHLRFPHKMERGGAFLSPVEHFVLVLTRQAVVLPAACLQSKTTV
jgi:hypothetical protein